jgi:hypothetical protein
MAKRRPVSGLSRWKKVAVAVGLLTVAYALWLACYGGLYFLADHKYETCVALATRPLTRTGIESCLGPHTISECDGTYPAGTHVKATGDCIRYSILGLEPIDVIYAWGEVVHYRPTYE